MLGNTWRYYESRVTLLLFELKYFLPLCARREIQTPLLTKVHIWCWVFCIYCSTCRPWRPVKSGWMFDKPNASLYTPFHYPIPSRCTALIPTSRLRIQPSPGFLVIYNWDFICATPPVKSFFPFLHLIF